MPNRQVRLDPDIVEWVESWIREWPGTSLSKATNNLLRMARDGEATDEPVELLEHAAHDAPRDPPLRPRKLPRGMSPRLAAILRSHGER